MPPQPAQPAQGANRFILILAAVCIVASVITVAVVLVNRSPNSSAMQRAWDHAHHDEIIRFKSEAESLAIAGKLAEAHAKYRELEKLVGGRSVNDPGLMDMVEQARQDQDKIFAILMRRLDAEAAAPSTAPAELEPAVMPVTPEENPNRFDASRVEAPHPTPSPEAPATAPIARVDTPPPLAVVEPPPAPASAPPDAPATVPAIAVHPPALANVAAAGTVPSITPISDAEVEKSIQRAIDYLVSRMKDGVIDTGEGANDTFNAGVNALCIYALLQSSRTMNDPRLSIKGDLMKQAIEKLKSVPVNPGQMFDDVGTPVSAPVVYTRSLRAAALATYDRPEDRKQLEADVLWLINASFKGAYTYDDRYTRKPKAPGSPQGRAKPGANLGANIILCDGIHNPDGSEAGGPVRTPMPPYQPGAPRPRYSQPRSPGLPRTFSGAIPDSTPPLTSTAIKEIPWDNSNSQYGLLGVWAGAEVGIEVPDAYWKAVDQHWKSCELNPGVWGYRGEDVTGTFSMTVAGIASLFVTHDYLDAPALGQRRVVSREPYSLNLRAALDWLNEKDNSVDVFSDNMHHTGYKLFGIERVGLASGYKFFGTHDWFAELAARVVPMQRPDGSFGKFEAAKHTLIETAYTVLFLVRGRGPILANKLAFNDFWSNRPREIANLTSYVSRELERPINWQVVDLTSDPMLWTDSPLLYMASHHDVNFDEAELAKLKQFVDAGGILVTHADNLGEEFNKYAATIAKKLFPAYELKELSTDHPLYSINANVQLPRPKLRAVSNGARLLMVHSPTDISNAWQMRASMSRKEAFQLGLNLYVYATGKEQFRNRLNPTAVPTPPEAADKIVHMARVKYEGNWDPEPGAWPRFAKIFQWETGVRVEVDTTEFAQLDAGKVAVAHLTGVEAFAPSAEQQQAMRKYVEDGGTVLIDAVGGGAFADSTATWLADAFANAAIEPVAPEDPLLKGFADLSQPKLRLYAIDKLGSGGSRLKRLKAGKGEVIVSTLDITSGLLGTSTWGILGYTPEYSQALAKNLILQRVR